MERLCNTRERQIYYWFTHIYGTIRRFWEFLGPLLDPTRLPLISRNMATKLHCIDPLYKKYHALSSQKYTKITRKTSSASDNQIVSPQHTTQTCHIDTIIIGASDCVRPSRGPTERKLKGVQTTNPLHITQYIPY